MSKYDYTERYVAPPTTSTSAPRPLLEKASPPPSPALVLALTTVIALAVSAGFACELYHEQRQRQALMWRVHSLELSVIEQKADTLSCRIARGEGGGR